MADGVYQQETVFRRRLCKLAKGKSEENDLERHEILDNVIETGS